MVVSLVTGVFVGIILGLRFRVFALIPAILLAAAIIVLAGSGQKLSAIVLILVGTVVSLQIGYIAGCMLRFVARSHLPYGRATIAPR